MKTKRLVSAGGVVYRTIGESLQIALCGHENPVSWRLPKGTPEPGESREETALRETREETGLQVIIEEQLGEIEYSFDFAGTRNYKTVHFYLMATTGGSTHEHDPEFDVVEWFDHDKATNALTYKNEEVMVRKALQILKSRCLRVKNGPAR